MIHSYAMEVKVFFILFSWPENQSCEFAFYFRIKNANFVFNCAFCEGKNIFMFMLSLATMHKRNKSSVPLDRTHAIRSSTNVGKTKLRHHAHHLFQYYYYFFRFLPSRSLSLSCVKQIISSLILCGPQ